MKEIRKKANYPVVRIKYQIMGEQYRRLVLRTFREILPNVYAHLTKRTHFIDYMLQTGVFNDPELDREHNQLYDRILDQYLVRFRQRELYGKDGDPWATTEYSCVFSDLEDKEDQLSQIPQRDGKAARVKKHDTFSWCIEPIEHKARRFNFAGQDPKLDLECHSEGQLDHTPESL